MQIIRAMLRWTSPVSSLRSADHRRCAGKLVCWHHRTARDARIAMENLDNDPSLAGQRSASSGSDFTHLEASRPDPQIWMGRSHHGHPSGPGGCVVWASKAPSSDL